DYAQADICFLNALGIKRASIFGTHCGAAIAVEIAASFPEAVDKLVLCSVPSFAPGMREKCINSYHFSPVEIKEDGSHLASRYWQPALKAGFRLGLQDRHLKLVAAAMASGGAYHGEQAFFRYDEEVRLPLIKSPTLIISPVEDILHQRLDIVSSLVSQCRTKIIQEAGNNIALEKPEELAQAILDFLENPDF
ncbi:alpha/beta fold hydrolase, partial [Chloroflexota bacterium]